MTYTMNLRDCALSPFTKKSGCLVYRRLHNLYNEGAREGDVIDLEHDSSREFVGTIMDEVFRSKDGGRKIRLFEEEEFWNQWVEEIFSVSSFGQLVVTIICRDKVS